MGWGIYQGYLKARTRDPGSPEELPGRSFSGPIRCEQPSGSMRPLVRRTGDSPQIPPAELCLPCSLMRHFIPEYQGRVTRLEGSPAQNSDPRRTLQSATPALVLASLPPSSWPAKSPRVF